MIKSKSFRRSQAVLLRSEWLCPCITLHVFPPFNFKPKVGRDFVAQSWNRQCNLDLIKLHRRVKRNWRSWLKVAQNLLHWHKNIAKEPWTDALCVCVCLTGRFVCVSVLSIVRGKYDLWSLIKWHGKIGDVSLDSCGLVVVGWWVKVWEVRSGCCHSGAVYLWLYNTHDFNPGQSCHVVQTKNQDLRISRTTSQRLGPTGQRPVNCEGISSQRTDEDTQHSFRNTY